MSQSVAIAEIDPAIIFAASVLSLERNPRE